MSDIEKIINDAWEVKDQINPNSDKQIIDSINKTIDHLNKGEITVAEPNGDDWKINQWIQKGNTIYGERSDDKLGWARPTLSNDGETLALGVVHGGSSKHGAGSVYRNTWRLPLPYKGFYVVKGTVDNFGKLFIDGV